MPTLVVDTREKKPYKFPGIADVVRKPLGVGDYTHEGYEDIYAVERKTLEDLARSLGRDRTRFKNEILRANGLAERNDNDNPLPGTKPDHGGLSEFVVVIEANRGDVEQYSDRLSRTSKSVGDLKRKALRGQTYVPYLPATHPNAILSTVDKWPSRYGSLQFVWAGDRHGGKQETLRLLDRWFLSYGST